MTKPIFEVEDAGSAATISNAAITSEKAVRQIKRLLIPYLTSWKQFIIRELRRHTSRRNEETSGLVQGPSRPRSGRFDMVTGAHLPRRAELLNGPMTPVMRQPDHMTPTLLQPNKQRQPLQLEDAEEEGEQLSNSPIDHVATAIVNLPHTFQLDAAHSRILNTHLSIFRGSKDIFNEFEHLLFNHLRPTTIETEKSTSSTTSRAFSCDKAIGLWQTLCINPEATLKDVLERYREEFANYIFKKVSNFKWDQLVDDPTKENFSDFLKTLKKTATQAFGDRAAEFVETLLFGKLKAQIQHKIPTADKWRRA